LFAARANFGNNIFQMARKTAVPLPAIRRALVTLGEDLRLARLRRRLSATLVAERAGMSRPTLRAIERGEPGVTLGAYASVLHVLGLSENLASLARDDELGRKLQDAELPARPIRRRAAEPAKPPTRTPRKRS
jgi:transcriptional regulator with XRE-family HTH domain